MELTKDEIKTGLIYRTNDLNYSAMGSTTQLGSCINITTDTTVDLRTLVDTYLVNPLTDEEFNYLVDNLSNFKLFLGYGSNQDKSNFIPRYTEIELDLLEGYPLDFSFSSQYLDGSNQFINFYLTINSYLNNILTMTSLANEENRDTDPPTIFNPGDDLGVGIRSFRVTYIEPEQSLKTKLAHLDTSKMGSTTRMGDKIDITTANDKNLKALIDTYLINPLTDEEFDYLLKNIGDYQFKVGIGDNRDDYIRGDDDYGGEPRFAEVDLVLEKPYPITLDALVYTIFMSPTSSEIYTGSGSTHFYIYVNSFNTETGLLNLTSKHSIYDTYTAIRSFRVAPKPPPPSVLPWETFQDRVDNFYYEQSSLGVIPQFKIYVTDDGVKQVVKPLNTITIDDSMEIMDFFLYPSKKTVSFEAREGFAIGSKVEVILYYQGHSADKKLYFGEGHSPVVYDLKITGRSYNASGLTKGEIYKYTCTSSFSGLDEKIDITEGDSIESIVNKISFITNYDGFNHRVAKSQDDIQIKKIFSDLSDYSFFKKGCGILELSGNTLKLKDTVGRVTVRCYESTIIGAMVYKEEADDFIQSVYWEEEDLELKNVKKTENPPTDEIVSQDDVNYKTYKDGRVQRNEDYFKKRLGKVLAVDNCFVQDGSNPEVGAINHIDERDEFLKYKLNQYQRKETFKVATKFIGLKLGDRARVKYNDKYHWSGVLIGKKMNFRIGNDIDFDFTISVMRNNEDWEPENDFWNEQWDSGILWKN